jgi:hypothetical protein
MGGGSANARFDLPARLFERLWLRVILACHLAAEADTRPLYDEANELVGIFIASVRRPRGPQTLFNFKAAPP